MNKHIKKILPITLLFATLFSCSSCNKKTATVNVIYGNGGGTYNVGDEVTVTADIPEDKTFKEWQSDNKFVSDNNPYTFTLNEDITLTAIFNIAQYTITVINGTGSGTYTLNSEVTITANEDTQTNHFQYWECNGKNVSNDRTYTFKAIKSATYTAIFEYEQTVEIKVINGTGSGTYTLNSDVTITADKDTELKHFQYWECDGKNVSNNRSYTFKATKSATYTAIFNYVSTVEIKTINGTGGGTYIVNSSVTITANEDTDTKYFEYWESGGEKISTERTYTFSATKNATYTAVFKRYRGTKKTNTTPIYLNNPYTVSEGGTLIVDYKYVDPVTDSNEGVSVFFGSDETHRFGNYKIMKNSLEKTYNGITFAPLDDGYYRMTIDIKLLTDVHTEYVAPTTISEVSFRWFEPTKGVYFDVNPGERREKTTEFKMNDDEFVIANYADIHVDDSCNFDYLTKTIEYGIEHSNPDIMVFSGDLAGSSAQLNKTINYLETLEIPYFVVLGNHDHQYLSYNTIEERLSQSNYGYIEKGPDELDSQGNYTIKIKNSDGDVVHGLIMMDSGDRHAIIDESKIEYVTNKISGVSYGSYNGQTTYCGFSQTNPYDGIRGNQIDWYASKVSELNCETTLIFHIPFLEFCKAYEQYRDAVNRGDQSAINAVAPIGGCHMGEWVSGAIENHGMFQKISDLNSTKNVICGHDHVNDFSLLYQGVRLTYAVKTGNGAYWKTDGSICGYTELKINSSGQATLDQVYFNPINK